MSDKKYDDEDLERIGGAVAEHLSAKMEVFFESFDTILDNKIRPLREDVTDLKGRMSLVEKAVAETNKDMRELARQSDLVEVQQDVKIIKAAVIDTDRHIQDHGKRIARLEARAA